ncbi:restriction endonuclease subunit S [Gallibacterium anatis]|uniref:restriction endonuclease subunit S n=1 Tax=Gallibacterium anatis TaxID=750 RepID=UPI001B337EEF|nr:restriction endonuclease subunit S [Gallibacterium anatis]MBP4133706.1 restriction endonuclease subunit S [Gallibacterium anatis]
MSEWTTSKLSDVIEIIGGGTPKRSETSYWNGNIPWLSVGDFNNDFRFVSNTSEKISKLGLQNSSTKLLKAGQLILSARGTVGCLAQLSIPMAFNQSCYGLNGKENIIDNGFLYYFLKNNINELKQKTHGSVFDTITRNTFEQINISYPNIKTQQVIARTLGFFDNKITLNTQTNQTLEQIAQAIFKHWFIDFAPVHAKANALARGETIEQAELAAMACLSGKTVEKITALKAQDPTAYHQLQQTAAAFPSEFVETEMGQVPKGWEVLKFKDFVKETKEKVGKLQGIEEYSVGNEGIYPRKEKYKKQLAKDPSKNKLIREANIVFGMGNKEVNWGIMRDKIGSVSSAYNIFQINDINRLFLDMFINNIPYYFRDIIKPTSRQGQTIDKEAFLEKAIYYPNKEIINIFLEKITQINELSTCIKSQNIYLLSIRDYLLPKLLGGEIKL